MKFLVYNYAVWYIIIIRAFAHPMNKEEQNMAYVITDACISCGACAAECPVEAISEGDGKYVIDPEKCIDCGNCAGLCPMGAPQPE